MRGERSEWPNVPFCSDRCRRIDLGRWLDGKYSIPVTRREEEDSRRQSDDEL